MSESQIQGIMEKAQNKIGMLQQQQVEQCFQNNPTNVNGFNKCFQPSLDRFEEVGKEIQLGMIFFGQQMQSCLQKNKDQAYCEGQVINQLSDFLDDVTRRM